jgi:hypothetical protein
MKKSRFSEDCVRIAVGRGRDAGRGEGRRPSVNSGSTTFYPARQAAGTAHCAAHVVPCPGPLTRPNNAAVHRRQSATSLPAASLAPQGTPGADRRQTGPP